MKIVDLSELTGDFFNRTEEEKLNCIENFYGLFNELLDDPDYDNDLILEHINQIITSSADEEAFELSHIFLQVKNKIEENKMKDGL